MRPQLRGKPIAVLAVLAETTCCIAASYEALERFLQHYPKNIVPYAIGVSLGGLLTAEEAARDLFQVKLLENEQKLNKAIDQLNLKYGKNTVYFGGAHGALKDAPMRIAFNHIPDLKTESDH